MPHRTSLVRRLADLRRQYTGETDTTVLPAAVHACKLLDTGERLLLAHNLDRNYASRLLGEEADPLPADLRVAVLPDASTSCQRELEADVLLAAGRAVNLLHPMPALAQKLNLRSGRVTRMVRSQPDGVVLHLERAVLGPLLLELLPRITEDGTVTGVPGLRATLHRRYVTLYPLHATKAEVSLAGVSFRQWAAALVHPITGLRGDRFFVVPQAEQIVVRSLTDDVFVVLEQLCEPVPPVAPPAPEVVAAWQAWNTRMWAPNRCWPAEILRPRTEDGDVELRVSTS